MLEDEWFFALALTGSFGLLSNISPLLRVLISLKFLLWGVFLLGLLLGVLMEWVILINLSPLS